MIWLPRINWPRFYWILPRDWDKMDGIFGFYRFDKCDCGCTSVPGWGMKLGFFGFCVFKKASK